MDLFPVRANGLTEFVERYEYSTAILTARSGREQRWRNRVHPRGGFAYSFIGRLGAQLEQRLEANLQGPEWQVPWWPYANPLLADATAGATTLSVDTDDVPWVGPGGIPCMIAVWRSRESWELAPLAAVATGTLTLDAPLAGDWPARGTFVIPARTGWVTGDISNDWHTFSLEAGRLDWQLNGVGPWTGSLELAPAVELLELMPSGPRPAAETIIRTLTVSDPGIGARTAYTEDPAARRLRSFVWNLKSRAAVRSMREFIDRRFGRAIPFRMPSWQQDLTLAAAYGPTTTEISVVSFGYAAHLFPQGQAYRRIYLRAPGGAAAIAAHVTAAVDNGDGTETLTLAAELGAAIDTSWDAMFLRHVRLDQDATEIRWKTASFATVALTVREVLEAA